MFSWDNNAKQSLPRDSVRHMALTTVTLALGLLLYRFGWALLLHWLPNGWIARTLYANSYVLELGRFPLFALRATRLVVLLLALADIILSGRSFLDALMALLPFLVTTAFYGLATQFFQSPLICQALALLLAAVGLGWAFGRFRKANVHEPMGILFCLFKLPRLLSHQLMPVLDRFLAAVVLGLGSLAFWADLVAIGLLIWQNKGLLR